MNQAIWKYQLAIEDTQYVQMPRDARLLHVGEQYGTLCVWALVNPSAPLIGRFILISGTGHSVPNGPYVGSAVMGGAFVWHVFDGGESRL